MITRNAKTLILGLAATLMLLAVSSTSAMAAKNQQSVIDDPGRILSPDPAVQTVALDEADELGFDILKIPVTWRAFTPDGTSRTKPAVDLTNPDNYPAGVWTTVDAAVSGAKSRGMKVWLMITAPAPRWAVRKETKPGLGAYEPDADDYAEFVEAVGKRYKKVRYFSFWNEVNLKRFMQPQSKRGAAQSAIHYREMYRAAQKALASNGHSKSKILLGEILSRYQSYLPRLATRPLTWLRAFFCIDSKGKALRGKSSRKYKCRRFKKIKASGLAYHPYNLSSPPTATEKASKDNAPIRYLPRVEKVLDQAYKAKRLSKKRMKIYNSEYGIQTNPPDKRLGQPLKKVPYYLNVSEYLTWTDSRVATYSQYLLIDDQESDTVSFQTGLRFADGEKKKRVYEAFQTPFMVFKTRSSNKITIWGCLRAKPRGTTKATLEVKSKGKWTSAKSIRVTASTGYFKQNVSMRGAKSKTYRITWSGGTSRSSKPGKRIKMRK